jgi:hypothetical protein
MATHTCTFSQEQYEGQGQICNLCGEHSRCARCHKRPWTSECEVCFRALCNTCRVHFRSGDDVCKPKLSECKEIYKNNRAHEREMRKLGY